MKFFITFSKGSLFITLKQQLGFDLILWKTVVKTFTLDLSFGNLMLGADERKFVLHKIFPNHWTSYFPYSLKINFLL